MDHACDDHARMAMPHWLFNPYAASLWKMERAPLAPTLRPCELRGPRRRRQAGRWLRRVICCMLLEAGHYPLTTIH